MKAIYNGRHRCPIVLQLGVKRQKRFQLSSARTTLSSRPPPLFRAGVLSRWLFPALIERLFSAHKMKWISAPEPEIARHRQHCHPLSIPFLSPSFLASFFIVIFFPRFSSRTNRCGPTSFSGERVTSLFGLITIYSSKTLSDSLDRDDLSESLNRNGCNSKLPLEDKKSLKFC